MKKPLLKVVAAAMCFAASATGSTYAQSSAVVATGVAALVKPGLWEITVLNESPGSDTTRSVVSRLCVSPAMATDVRQLLPTQHEFGLQCQNREPKQTGLEVSWQITCAGKGGTLGGAGTLSFAGGGYQGRSKLDRSGLGAKPSKVVQIMSGRWLETCSP